MGGATTEIEIQSAAVQLLGKKGFTTLANAGEFGNAAKTGYDNLIDSEMSFGNWRFCSTTIELSSTGTDPDYKHWSNSYQMPSGWLAVHSMEPQISYEIFGDKLYTSGSGLLKMEYRKEVAVSFWPSYFRMYFIYSLGYWLALSVTESESMANRIEKERDRLLGVARYIESQNSPNIGIQRQPYVDVRR